MEILDFSNPHKQLCEPLFAQIVNRISANRSLYFVETSQRNVDDIRVERRTFRNNRVYKVFEPMRDLGDSGKPDTSCIAFNRMGRPSKTIYCAFIDLVAFEQ